MPDRACPRCGEAAGTGTICPSCGVGLYSETDAISVDRPLNGRLSQQDTIPDHLLQQARTGDVRTRVLAPPRAAGPDYELQAILGEGGMGVVWSARQAGLGREVAIKRIRPGAGPRAAAQLLAEAQLTGSLEHPGIMPVHETGVDQDGVPFYAMRRLRGRTWAERWSELSQSEHLDVLLRVCDAVAYAHGQGVIHRDLKPANVFLGEYGEVVVFDWGLAARVSDLRVQGLRLLASGTPVYMAPEMARAQAGQLGPASDVYLLGAILFEILTGQAPHPGEQDVEILMAAADNRIEPPIPPGELGDVVRRAMAAEPGDRYGDVRSFQVAVRTCLRHQESIALAERAARRLSEASRDAGYSGFARAVHAFEDALDMWPDNRVAAGGLATARLEFAVRAHRAGDLDLAAGLLSAAEPAHAMELGAIARTRQLRQRRRRALRILTWASLGLVIALVAALAVGYRAVAHQRDLVLSIARERDEAEAALAREEQAETASTRRMWRRVVQADFLSAGLPPQTRVVGGRWGITSASLVAEGDRPAILAVPLPSTSGLVVQIDLEPGGRLVLLFGDDAAALARGSAGAGVSVEIGSAMIIRRGDLVLQSSALPEAVAGLARRLRLEFDRGSLRILVDGKAAHAPLPVPALRLGHVGLAADPGAVLDNLKVEVPWE